MYSKIPKEYHGILRLDIRNATTNTPKPDGLNIIKPTEVVYLKDESRDNDEEELFRQKLRQNLIDF